MLAKIAARQPHGKSSAARLEQYITDAEKSDPAYLEMDGVFSLETAAVEFESEIAEYHAQHPNAAADIDPLYHVILTWREGERPTPAQAAEASLHLRESLGLAGHQFIAAAHTDTDNFHLHLMINKINPDTFELAYLRNDYLTADRACREVEIKQGWKHDRGPYRVQYQGDEAHVVHKRDRKLLRALSDGAKKVERYSDEASFERWAQESGIAEFLAKAPSWQAVHSGAALYGVAVEPSKNSQGLVLRDLKTDDRIKFSSIGEDLSGPKMERRLGAFEADKSALDDEIEGILNDLTRDQSVFSAGDLDRYLVKYVAPARHAIVKGALNDSVDLVQLDNSEFDKRGLPTKQMADTATWLATKPEAWTPAQSAQAQTSFHLWRDDNPDAAARYGFDGYVRYTQRQEAERIAKGETGHATSLRPSLYTTRAIVETERQAVDTATAMADRHTHMVKPADIDAGIAHCLAVARRRNPDAAHGLRPEDQLPVYQSVMSGGDFGTVTGWAGVGKSFAMAGMRVAYERAGYRVIGGGPTNVIKNAMLDDGFHEAATVDSILAAADKDKLDWTRDTIVIIDEAGMVKNDNLARLIDIADEKGAKLVLVGHDAQLPAVERGGLFSDLSQVRSFGDITTITRQKDTELREVATLLSEKKTDEAVKILEDTGRIEWSFTDDDSKRRLLADWQASHETDPGRQKFVLSYENSDVAFFNSEIHSYRQARGELGNSTQFGKTQMSEGEPIVILDTIVMSHGRGKPRTRLSNGQRGTITSVCKDAIFADFDGKSVEIPVAQAQNVGLAYAGTVYKSQGATITETYLHHSRFYKDAAGYVAMTRATETMTLYANRENTTDAGELAEQLQASMTKTSTVKFTEITRKPIAPAIAETAAPQASLVAQRDAAHAVLATIDAIPARSGPVSGKARQAELRAAYERESTANHELRMAAYLEAMANARFDRDTKLKALQVSVAAERADIQKNEPKVERQHALAELNEAAERQREEIRAEFQQERERAGEHGKSPKRETFRDWKARHEVAPVAPQSPKSTEATGDTQKPPAPAARHVQDELALVPVAAENLLDFHKVAEAAGYRHKQNSPDRKTSTWQDPISKTEVIIAKDAEGHGVRAASLTDNSETGNANELLKMLKPSASAEERKALLQPLVEAKAAEIAADPAAAKAEHAARYTDITNTDQAYATAKPVVGQTEIRVDQNGNLLMPTRSDAKAQHTTGMEIVSPDGRSYHARDSTPGIGEIKPANGEQPTKIVICATAAAALKRAQADRDGSTSYLSIGGAGKTSDKQVELIAAKLAAAPQAKVEVDFPIDQTPKAARLAATLTQKAVERNDPAQKVEVKNGRAYANRQHDTAVQSSRNAGPVETLAGKRLRKLYARDLERGSRTPTAERDAGAGEDLRQAGARPLLPSARGDDATPGRVQPPAKGDGEGRGIDVQHAPSAAASEGAREMQPDTKSRSNVQSERQREDRLPERDAEAPRDDEKKSPKLESLTRLSAEEILAVLKALNQEQQQRLSAVFQSLENVTVARDDRSKDLIVIGASARAEHYTLLNVSETRARPVDVPASEMPRLAEANTQGQARGQSYGREP
jgi:hypothetical protein